MLVGFYLFVETWELWVAGRGGLVSVEWQLWTATHRIQLLGDQVACRLASGRLVKLTLCGKVIETISTDLESCLCKWPPAS
jgi:hypothetical protein